MRTSQSKAAVNVNMVTVKKSLRRKNRPVWYFRDTLSQANDAMGRVFLES